MASTPRPASSALIAGALLAGCARAPIEDGARVGPLVQIKDGFTSVFSLPHSDGVALFDAGIQRDAERVTAGLDASGFTPAEVTHVFITHGHGDHVAGLPAFPNAAVVAHFDEQGLLATEGVRPHVLANDGDVFDVGGRSIEALHTPGHTAGSAVWLVSGVLVLGDVALANRDGGAIEPPAGFSDDPEQNVESVRALADRLDARGERIQWLAPAHSAPLRGLDPLRRFPAE